MTFELDKDRQISILQQKLGEAASQAATFQAAFQQAVDECREKDQKIADLQSELDDVNPLEDDLEDNGAVKEALDRM